ncbi:hypothetical protein MRX96_044078 [Rhipicephalus microplus]
MTLTGHSNVRCFDGQRDVSKCLVLTTTVVDLPEPALRNCQTLVFRLLTRFGILPPTTLTDAQKVFQEVVDNIPGVAVMFLAGAMITYKYS